MFKTEPHLHVQEVSQCSHIRADQMIKLYKEAGYDTVFITDHFSPNFLNSLGDIPWKDKITIFLSGYFKAKEAGRKYGVTVLPAAEVSILNSPNDYLVYGITREFLEVHPDLCLNGVDNFYKIAKQNGIFIVQAHPYRDNVCYPTPEYVDAFEIYNSNPRHDDQNDKAKECALNNNLYTSAGSDGHRLDDVALSGVLSENKISTVEDYIELIKSGKAEIIKGDSK